MNTVLRKCARSVFMGSGLAPSARPGTTVSLLILAPMGLVLAIHAFGAWRGCKDVDARDKRTAVRFDFCGRGAWHGFSWVSSDSQRSRHQREATPCFTRIAYFTA